MTRTSYYLTYIACLLGTLLSFELCWIGAKYVLEGCVVHTYLDHFIAVCAAFHLTGDAMRLWVRLQRQNRAARPAAAPRH